MKGGGDWPHPDLVSIYESIYFICGRSIKCSR